MNIILALYLFVFLEGKVFPTTLLNWQSVHLLTLYDFINLFYVLFGFKQRL